MMKVGILTSIITPDWGGVYQYTLSLLKALKNYPSDKFEYIQIRSPTFPKILDRDIVVSSERSGLILKLKRFFYTYMGLKIGDIRGQFNNLNDIDLLVSPFITLIPYFIGKPYIVTIHDFQHKYYPKFFSLKERLWREILYNTGKHACIVICESNFIKRDIMRFLCVPEGNIRVLASPPLQFAEPHDIDDQKLQKIKAKYSLPDKFLFYPAHFWYHKNHINLLEALHRIRCLYKEEIPLVLVGLKRENFENVIKKIDELNMKKQIRYLGYVPDDDLPYLYRLSTALVVPTLFESLSLPIWEAFYLGTPVVSSNVCALPEQVGDAGLLFNPNNIEDMAEKIYRIWTDEELRKKLVKRGYERVRNLSLENYAKQWEKIIEEALQIAKIKN